MRATALTVPCEQWLLKVRLSAAVVVVSMQRPRSGYCWKLVCTMLLWEHRGGAKVIVRDVCVICSGICVVDCCVLVLVHKIPSSKVECVFKCNGGSRCSRHHPCKLSSLEHIIENRRPYPRLLRCSRETHGHRESLVACHCSY